jgi:hypothetical protein
MHKSQSTVCVPEIDPKWSSSVDEGAIAHCWLSFGGFRKEDLRPQTSAFGDSSQTYWEGEQLVEISGKRGGRIAVANQSIEQRTLGGRSGPPSNCLKRS